jgi:hypothetical protein
MVRSYLGRQRLLLLLFLGYVLFLTIRLGVAEADFRRNPEIGLRSIFWLNATNLATYNSSPGQLRAAVSLNPRAASAWISLGLDTEADGNLPQAEADLLQAARVDHQYLPAWTLTNFYFRRGDSTRFWLWAQRAATLTFDDYRPLLRLADAFDRSPKSVATRLAGGAPLLRAYLDLLIGEGRLDAAQEIAGSLAALHDSSDHARLDDLADRVSRVH